MVKRRTISLSESVDNRLSAELEHGDSRSEIIEEALREHYDMDKAAQAAHAGGSDE